MWNAPGQYCVNGTHAPICGGCSGAISDIRLPLPLSLVLLLHLSAQANDYMRNSLKIPSSFRALRVCVCLWAKGNVCVIPIFGTPLFRAFFNSSLRLGDSVEKRSLAHCLLLRTKFLEWKIRRVSYISKFCAACTPPFFDYERMWMWMCMVGGAYAVEQNDQSIIYYL